MRSYIFKNLGSLLLIIIIGWTCNYKSENSYLLSSEIDIKLKEYQKKYPFYKYEVPTKQSYHISFFRIKEDTVLCIIRQPFLFYDIPSFISRPNKLNIQPKLLGVFENSRNEAIAIYDTSDSLGKHIYYLKGKQKLAIEPYQIKEAFDTFVPPAYLYKYKNKQWIKFHQSDTISIK